MRRTEIVAETLSHWPEALIEQARPCCHHRGLQLQVQAPVAAGADVEVAAPGSDWTPHKLQQVHRQLPG